ncbi:hypothetical protein OE88DRAFT_630545 [Heliocybe sulcata]|uniref:Uncharacterized protein n=1 Tax=Heliocybe sulcata TaxID=5364 RepID=A0A5C3NCV5_9AGAM|nr:hypothetical protein OE88DRAFT_630545 [Heliocybe sulcata]
MTRETRDALSARSAVLRWLICSAIAVGRLTRAVRVREAPDEGGQTTSPLEGVLRAHQSRKTSRSQGGCAVCNARGGGRFSSVKT